MQHDRQFHRRLPGTIITKRHERIDRFWKYNFANPFAEKRRGKEIPNYGEESKDSERKRERERPEKKENREEGERRGNANGTRAGQGKKRLYPIGELYGLGMGHSVPLSDLL